MLHLLGKKPELPLHLIVAICGWAALLCKYVRLNGILLSATFSSFVCWGVVLEDCHLSLDLVYMCCKSWSGQRGRSSYDLTDLLSVNGSGNGVCFWLGLELWIQTLKCSTWCL